MIVTINKSVASGTIVAPPSKSYAHRLLIVAGLTENDTVIKNVELSNDIIATINCIKTLGKEVTIDGSTLHIKRKKEVLEDTLIFDCMESGSTFRFFIPIALALKDKAVFRGTKRLIERGISAYEKIFDKMGIKIEKDETEIRFFGKLKPGIIDVEANISSQFITGLLFSLPLLEEDSIINLTTKLNSSNYVDITLDVLAKANIKVDVLENGFYIRKNGNYISDILEVEKDYSNAAFLDALNYFGGSVNLIGLNPNSYQGDKVYKKHFEVLSKGYATIDIENCIDLGPILFCFSALKYGGRFVNTTRLKIKESDRVKDLAEELSKFGIIVRDFGNEVEIDNSKIKCPSEVLNGKNDHRIVMALSIMLSVFGGTIKGAEAVSKSYPTFFNDLAKLKIEVKFDE